MNIGLLVYSVSGHSLSVAKRLKARLEATGHTATMVRLETVGGSRLEAERTPLKALPELDAYDGLVVCSPVRGGALPPPVCAMMEQLSGLEHKRVACLLTHAFRPTWGANQTLAQMRELCQQRGMSLCGACETSWHLLGREKNIARAVECVLAALAG